MTHDKNNNNMPSNINNRNIPSNFNKNNNNLICKHHQMMFKIKANTFKPNITIKSVTFNEKRCGFNWNQQSGEYSGSTEYTSCGSTMHEETDHILFKNIARIYYVADGDTDPLVERVMRYFIKKKKDSGKFQKGFLGGG